MVRHSHKVGEVVEFRLSLGGLVYHYGVVEVTALDEAGLEQRLDVANEHERAGLRHFGTEVGYAVESGILVGQELRLEIHLYVETEIIVGQKHELRAGGRVDHFHLVLHVIEVFVGSLLGETHIVYRLEERTGAAVEDRHFGAVDFDKHIIHAGGIKGSHSMLYSAYSSFALAYYGAAVGRDHIFGHCFNHRLTFEVYALYLVSVVFGSRAESGHESRAGVKALALERKLIFESDLLHYFST